MKSYSIERIKLAFDRESTEKLREETEKLINRKVNEGFEFISVEFKIPEKSGFIYSFIVFRR